MIFDRLAYRTHQFWRALVGPPIRVETKSLLPYLSSPQITLFYHMRASEQAHGYFVFETLKNSGQTDPDLLAAALLHDAGKIFYPPSLVERVTVVLGNFLFRQNTIRWSDGPPTGLRRPFVVAIHHPAWGADLARKSGASPRCVDLIRHHHDPVTNDDPLLAALQAADDKN